MSVHPSNSTLKRFKVVKLDPNALANRGSFDELNLAALWRGVEDTNAKAADARAPNADFSCKSPSVRATRLLRIGIGTHAREGNRNCVLIETTTSALGGKLTPATRSLLARAP